MITAVIDRHEMPAIHGLPTVAVIYTARLFLDAEFIVAEAFTSLRQAATWADTEGADATAWPAS